MRSGLALTNGHTIAEISDLLRRRDVTAADVAGSMLQRIGEHEAHLKAFITVMAEEAMRSAKGIDKRFDEGEPRRRLDGIVIAIKDNVDVAGVVTTAGLSARRHTHASDDAEIARRLRAAGAVFIGKTNMDEAAMGGTTTNPFFGYAQNPYRSGHTAGGSSGGSAAALAAGFCHAALGTDTLGSSRIPASYCGAVAMKPTRGFISSRGVVPLCHRLDSVGLLTRSVSDLGLLLDVVAGFDPDCVDSVSAPETHVEFGKIRIGLLREMCGISVEAPVRAAFDVAMRTTQSLDWQTIELSLGDYDPARARRAGLLLGEADASVTHADILTSQPESLSDGVRGLMTYGRDVKGERLARAARLVEVSRHRILRALRDADVIMTPTTPQTAFAFEHQEPANQGDFTALANLAGCPAVSIPILAGNGMPCGIQFIGRPFAEHMLVNVAAAFESALPHVPRPAIGS